MNPKKRLTQIAPNIFRVDRWNTEPELKESFFVTQPAQAFLADPAFSCTENDRGLLEFGLHGRTVLSEQDTEFTQGFAIGPNDGIYGLGMHQYQRLNRRNMVCQMVQINGKIIAVPFLTSTAGYAILFDTCAYMSIGIDRPCTREILPEYEPEEKTPNQIQVFADDSDTFTYYVILGDTMDQQIAGYRLLTGKSPMLARWAYGFFQSREHYQTQDEILSVAHEFRRRGIPLDCIVQDWNYWGDLGWNACEWDPKKYPDPKKMVDEIHGLDMKIMLSVWSSFGPQTHICKELEKQDKILAKPDPKKENWGRVHDVYDPAASKIVWRYMKDNLFSTGIDAWWLDSTEPAMEADTSTVLLDAKNTILGSNRRYLNTYAAAAARNCCRHQRAETEDKRVFILTRSGYAGQQAAAAASWTGDIQATWDTFKRQIPSLLSFSASGIPYSTTDIGAFFVNFPDCGNGKTENPEYREMYTRWFWFGAFSPLFRSHGTSTPREMWFFGEPGTQYYDAQMAASRLRYALMPYIYASAFRVFREDATLMRPLAMDFPGDARARELDDTYLFGRNLLVHAVTDYQIRQARVYLPAGTEWVDFFSGQRHAGGQEITVDAPLDRLPLFAKAGSMILMTEPDQCTAWMKETTLKLRLFPGRDCETFYYRDDGDNYSYESGKYAAIPFAWNDAARTLTIGAAQGCTEAYDLNKTIEISIDGKPVTTAEYRGQALTVNL